jgi:peptidoglycan/LPS O-acetylase OafA/YrhL
MKTSASSPHLPALDGLRGLALLGVLLFHSKKALPGGYLGVDLFFVLSGYLITSLVTDEHRTSGRVDLGAFWVRRARRLLPALLSLMPAIALYCAFVAPPEELTRIRGDALATLGYFANWRAIYSHKSYWELFAAPSPLEHMWSLAIEEQFYIVWPVALRLVLGRSSRALLPLSLALMAMSGALAIGLVVLHPHATSRVYFGTDTRATAMLAGAALAAVMPRTTTFRTSTAKKLDGLGVLGAIVLGAAWWKLDGESPFLYRGGFWLTELAALALIACAVVGPEQSLVARALAIRPLVLVGVISYGLYLWHWPVNVLLTPERFTSLGEGACRVLQPTASFAIAIVSYLVLERPIRARGLPFRHPSATTIAVPLAFALSALLVIVATRGAHPRAPAPAAIVLADVPPPSPTPESPTFRIAIFGDSTAGSLGWTLRGVRKPGVSVALLGKDGCTMLYDGCNGEQWTSKLRELEPHATLFFVGGAFMHEVELENGRSISACHPTWDAKLERVLAKRLADLARFEPKTRVFALTSPRPLGTVWGGPELRRQTECINKSIRRIASAIEGVHGVPHGGRERAFLVGSRANHDGPALVREDGCARRPWAPMGRTAIFTCDRDATPWNPRSRPRRAACSLSRRTRRSS